MMIYRVSWSWYEEYAPREFYSNIEYSQQEFEVLIKKLMKEAANAIVETEEGYIGNHEIIEKVWELLEKEGFQEVEYRARYNLWGSRIIRADDEEYLEHLDKETLEKIYKHNQKIEDNIFHELKK